MTLRGGLIGCGYFADNHLNAWNDVDGASIVAVCDLDVEKATAAAVKFGIEAVHTDAAQMLNEMNLDYVDIVTTVGSHKLLVEMAALAGVHVICQKPFALSLADGQTMVKACEDAGVRLMVHENFRWQTPMRAVKAHAADIGDLFFGQVQFRSGFDVYANQPYLATDERFIIYDLGIHLLDLSRFFLGDVESLTCLTQRVNPNINGEDVATILMKMTSGATCIVDVSYFSKLERERFPQTFVYLEGTNGSVQIEHDYHLTQVVGDQITKMHVPPIPRDWTSLPGLAIQDSVVAIHEHWVRVLNGEETLETSGADNLKTLELVFGAYESAEGGTPYRLS